MTAAVKMESCLLVDVPMLEKVEVEHICDFSIDFDPVQTFLTSRAFRQNYIIKSGQVRGPRLRGEFLPGGGDWLTVDQDGVAGLDVRATIRTDDGELIYVTNAGRGHTSAEARARLEAGALLKWNEVFARSSPLFETGAANYRWLNRVVTIAINEFSRNHVNYRIYSVK